MWVGGVQDEMNMAVWNPHGVGGGCRRGVEFAAADLSGRIWVGFLFSSKICFCPCSAVAVELAGLVCVRCDVCEREFIRNDIPERGDPVSVCVYARSCARV